MIGRLFVRNYSSLAFQESKRVVESTTLSNGLKVVSLVGGYTGPAVSLGLYIKTGSRNETQATAGLNQVLKGLAFESNTNKLGIEVQRDIEVSGSTAFVQASRDNLLISTQTLPNYSLQMLKNLANITKPTLPFHEVRDVASLVGEESNAYNHDSYTTLMESVHQTAFRGKTLGRPLVAPLCNLDNISHENVVDWVNATYKPNNMVLVGVGLSHSELIEEADKVSFGSKSSDSNINISNEKAQYIGGESLKYSTGNSKVVLAFEGTAQSNVKDVAAFSVLQQILGVGCPKLAPGSGRTSKLFNLTKNNSNIVKSEAFNLTYADSGLFGIFAEVESNVSKTLSLLTSEIASSSKVAGQDLERAKAITKSQIIEQADHRSGALEFIGKQAIASDVVLTPAQFAEEISKVTSEDIKRVLKKMTSQKPTLVVVGDVSDVPTMDSIQSSLKL